MTDFKGWSLDSKIPSLGIKNLSHLHTVELAIVGLGNPFQCLVFLGNELYCSTLSTSAMT